MLLQLDRRLQGFKRPEPEDKPKQNTYPATVLLVIACCAFYPLTEGHTEFYFNRLCLANPAKLYTLATSLFVHAGIPHLASNMFFLFFFGKSLERKMGSWQFLLLYMAGGVGAAYFGSWFYNPHTYIVGASGAISTVIALLMLYNPWKLSFFLNLLPMPVGVAGFTYLFINTWSAITGEGLLSHVAYEVHIAGFVLGLLVGVAVCPHWQRNIFVSLLQFILYFGVVAYLYWMR